MVQTASASMTTSPMVFWPTSPQVENLDTCNVEDKKKNFSLKKNYLEGKEKYSTTAKTIHN
jgi:hypothetical protein